MELTHFFLRLILYYRIGFCNYNDYKDKNQIMVKTDFDSDNGGNNYGAKKTGERKFSKNYVFWRSLIKHFNEFFYYQFLSQQKAIL